MRAAATTKPGSSDRSDPLLADGSMSERTQRLAQLVAVTDLYMWKVLRRDLGLSRDETEMPCAISSTKSRETGDGSCGLAFRIEIGCLPDEGGVLHSARSVTHHQGGVVSTRCPSGEE